MYLTEKCQKLENKSIENIQSEKEREKKAKKKKPLTEHEEQVEQHQKQYTCNWSPRRSRKYYAEETTETIVNN